VSDVDTELDPPTAWSPHELDALRRIASRLQAAGIGGPTCWEWPGFTSGGCPSVMVRGRVHPVHRYTLRALHGVDVEDRDVLSICENRRCVNPHHMDPDPAAPAHWARRNDPLYRSRLVRAVRAGDGEEACRLLLSDIATRPDAMPARRSEARDRLATLGLDCAPIAAGT